MQAAHEQSQSILRVNFKFQDPVRQRLMGFVGGALERVLLFDQLNAVYHQTLHAQDSRHFHEKLLETLQIRYEVSQEDVARIPPSGPVVVTSNHPFGAIEGIILASILRSVRCDVKLMANFLLESIPELRDLFIPVDPFAHRSSATTNVRALRETLRWLKSGGMLGVFPAGEVSHIDLQSRRVTDPEWSGSIARIIQATGASALPVYFDGANGFAFQVLGLVHPSLRTAMLPHEFLNKRDSTLKVRIGRPVPFKKLLAYETDLEMTTYLRHRTYALGVAGAAERESVKLVFPLKIRKTTQEPIAPPAPAELISMEIESLPSSQCLQSGSELAVFHARAGQIPWTLQEIGRLREIAFRAEAEGSGKARDLDEFDSAYIHIFLWNPKAHEIVGAYRLGPTDEILPASGLHGLYTSTLFNLDADFPRRVDPALEMGRSFIRPEYQRAFGALLLLWMGIGKFILKNPRYRMLFGAVSISSRYRPLSRQLMVSYLRSHHYLQSLAGLVKARNPFRPKGGQAFERQTIELIGDDADELSTIISDMESDGAGIPVLLRHYLKLGGRFLGFNVDPNFSNVVDGLILVDLTQVDMKILERFMGKNEAAGYVASHRGMNLLAN